MKQKLSRVIRTVPNSVLLILDPFPLPEGSALAWAGERIAATLKRLSCRAAEFCASRDTFLGRKFALLVFLEEARNEKDHLE